MYRRKSNGDFDSPMQGQTQQKSFLPKIRGSVQREEKLPTVPSFSLDSHTDVLKKQAKLATSLQALQNLLKQHGKYLSTSEVIKKAKIAVDKGGSRLGKSVSDDFSSDSGAGTPTSRSSNSSGQSPVCRAG